jgi:hypothetical protein
VLFDLFIVPALLWRKTRPWAFVTVILFHLINSQLFSIGVFPWLGIAATTIFFEPSWPRDAIRWIRKRFGRETAAAAAQIDPQLHQPSSPLARRIIVSALAIYVTIQILLPLRHVLYPGDVDWTYEGHRFSWRMKLHDRDSRVDFTVRDPGTGTVTEVDLDNYLGGRQSRKIGARPDMVLQMAHHLAAEAESRGIKEAQVFATVRMSLNGRQRELLIDPNVDLAHQPRNVWPATWILHPQLGPPP